MIYDKTKRCFIFNNKAEAKPGAMLFYDLPRLLSEGEEICEEAILRAETLPHMGPFVPYIDVSGDAKPHQIFPIGWVMACNGTGIVGYGMGLGKTFIAIRAAAALKRKRVLVLCPSHLKDNWAKEIKKWEPLSTTHICEGRDSEMDVDATYTIINRDILPDNLEKLLDQPFDQYIVDECHKCGNWGTAGYNAFDTLCKKARKSGTGILLLTGTLFKNSPMDAHTALHLLDPHIPGPRGAFESRFDPIGQLRKKVLGLLRRGKTPQWLIGKKWGEIKALEKSKGTQGDVEGLRWLLSQYAIRKKYSDVFPDDGKTRTTKFVSVDLNLTEKQRQVMNSKGVLEDDGKVNGDLATILRIVAEQKAPFVADYAEAWLEEHEGKKLVIASWHIKATEIILKELERFGVVRIHGTPKQKSKAETAFREDPEIRVCVINLESGGTGLNLVSASDFIFSEVPWTSAAYEQAGARIDRMGQLSDDINYTVFLAADTPEGAKFGTVKKKSGLNERYLGEK